MSTLKQSEIIKKTGLKFYQIEYLLKMGKIKAYQFGKGIPRQFPPETVDRIREIMDNRNGPGQD